MRPLTIFPLVLEISNSTLKTTTSDTKNLTQEKEFRILSALQAAFFSLKSDNSCSSRVGVFKILYT